MNKPRFFIDRTIEDIEILSNFFDVMIITDIRLPLEITAIKERFNDVVSVNIKRINFESPLTDKQQKHKIENAMENFNGYDYKVTNDTLDKLNIDAINIVEREEEK